MTLSLIYIYILILCICTLGKCDVDALWEIANKTLPPKIIDSCQDIENNISKMWKVKL